jgi:hypothetical protein
MSQAMNQAYNRNVNAQNTPFIANQTGWADIALPPAAYNPQYMYQQANHHDNHVGTASTTVWVVPTRNENLPLRFLTALAKLLKKCLEVYLAMLMLRTSLFAALCFGLGRCFSSQRCNARTYYYTGNNTCGNQHFFAHSAIDPTHCHNVCSPSWF